MAEKCYFAKDSTKETCTKNSDCQESRKIADETAQENVRDSENKNETSTSSPPPSVEAIADDETAATRYKEGFFPEVSTFAERELVHLFLPKSSGKNSSSSKLCDSAPCENPSNADPILDGGVIVKHQQELKQVLTENCPMESKCHRANKKLDKLQACFTDKGVTPRNQRQNRAHCQSPVAHEESFHKDIPLAMDEKTSPLTWRSQGKDGRHFATVEPAQTTSSPLPKLRHVAPKDVESRRVTWIGVMRHSTGGSPVLVNGSRPPTFQTARQQTLVIKSLRHSKERGCHAVNGNLAAKRNTVQLRGSRRTAELNLPHLSPALRAKANRKSVHLRMDFGWNRR